MESGAVMDGVTLFFAKKKWMYLQLNVSSTVVWDKSCGISSSDVLEWLWETGKLIVNESKELPTENVTITAHDVKDGKLITPFKQLRRDPSLHI
jgi:hypothetical protein